MQELESQLLRLAISRGKKNHFIQIPTASSHEGQSRREHWQSLGKEQSDRIGSHCIYLPIHEREDAFNPDYLDLIADAGLIYFSGGDPHRVAEIFSGSPLWEEIIKQFGGAIMGLRRSSHSPGLSLLPNIEVIPHYDKMLGWLPDRVASFVLRSDSESVLLGIDEYTALVHTDSWRRVGRGKVHVLRGSLDFIE